MKQGIRIQVPVAQLEYVEGSHTIWIHSPQGATVLRIKCTGKITSDQCKNSPTSHGDIIVEGDIQMCISEDASS